MRKAYKFITDCYGKSLGWVLRAEWFALTLDSRTSLYTLSYAIIGFISEIGCSVLMYSNDFYLKCLDLLCVELWLLLSSSSSPVNLELFVKPEAFKESSEASFIPHYTALFSLNFLLTPINGKGRGDAFLREEDDESESLHVLMGGYHAFISLS